MTDAPTPRDVIGPLLIPDGHSDREREVARSWADDILSALHSAGYVVERGWQPIATTPRDGTAVLCWPFNYSSLFEGKAEPEIVIGFFSEDDWWCESTVAKTFDPTHWRPLPALPQ